MALVVRRGVWIVDVGCGMWIVDCGMWHVACGLFVSGLRVARCRSFVCGLWIVGKLRGPRGEKREGRGDPWVVQ